MSFEFQGIPFNISKQREMYNNIYLKSLDNAIKGRIVFSRMYDERFNSMADIIKWSSEVASDIIFKFSAEAVDDIVNNGAYDLDSDLFYKKYYNKYNSWGCFFDIIENQYKEIILDNDELDDYRAARRDNRGGLVGGGFGVEGAATGIFIAGAVNATLGAANMFFDSIGKSFSIISKNVALNTLYKNPEVKNLLCDGISIAILEMHRAHFDALAELGKVDISGAVSQEDIAKAGRIFLNLLDGKIPENKTTEVLSEIINLNPYDDRFYQYALEKYSDSYSELKKISEYFGISLGPLTGNINPEAEFSLDIEITLTSEYEKNKLLILDLINPSKKIKSVQDVELKSIEARERKFQENIIVNYKTIKEQSFFVSPDMDDFKIKNFTNEVLRLFNEELSAGSILVYFDETLFGLGDKGVAVTSSKVFITVGKIGVIKISDILEVNILGVINKSIRVKLKNNDFVCFELTQGNKGAVALVEILQLMVNAACEK